MGNAPGTKHMILLRKTENSEKSGRTRHETLTFQDPSMIPCSNTADKNNVRSFIITIQMRRSCRLRESIQQVGKLENASEALHDLSNIPRQAGF